MDYKSILGVLSVALAVVAYIKYFRDIYRGTTKPHVFSWLVWGILTLIGFGIQIMNGAGAGAWVGGFTGIISLVIAGIALKQGATNITKSDYFSLFGACIAFILWIFAEQPLLSIILLIVIDALGFYMTFRKSYFKPGEESAFSYTLNGLKFVIALFALGEFTLITVLYPAYLIVANLSFVVMVLIRRRVLAKALQ